MFGYSQDRHIGQGEALIATLSIKLHQSATKALVAVVVYYLQLKYWNQESVDGKFTKFFYAFSTLFYLCKGIPS